VIVVDANILAYLQLPGAHTTAAEVLHMSDPDWAAPTLWRSEFRNILAGYLRRGSLTLDQACRIQDETEDLMREAEYELDSARVLRLLPDSDCSAYDCEYVALATKLGVSLVTRDQRVLRAFPSVAVDL
jgi:predicted nucleic acid-binding protein